MNTNDPGPPPDSEFIVWQTLAEALPPSETCLFLRLERDDNGMINFCTGWWDQNHFQYLSPFIPPGIVELPAWWKVTHWAFSEAANKTWFTYAWDKPGHYYVNAPTDGRIL